MARISYGTHVEFCHPSTNCAEYRTTLWSKPVLEHQANLLLEFFQEILHATCMFVNYDAMEIISGSAVATVAADDWML